MESKHTRGKLIVTFDNRFPYDMITLDERGSEVFRTKLPCSNSRDKSPTEAMSGVNWSEKEKPMVIEKQEKALANEILRASAPELLDTLIDVSKNLCVLQGQMSDIEKTNNLAIGMSDKIYNWNEEIERKIKNATQL